MMDKSFIKAGDVLLCYSVSLKEKTIENTGSVYNHVAICLGDGVIAEATFKKINKTSIDRLLDEYDHIAVKRLDGFWSIDREIKLKKFINDIIDSGARFNTRGIRDFFQNKDRVESEEMEKVLAYFEGKQEPPNPCRDEYFCSELIVCSYIYVGIIQQSAAMVYEPSKHSPYDVGRDPTFGNFIGYMTAIDNYVVPDKDDFYDEIVDISHL